LFSDYSIGRKFVLIPWMRATVCAHDDPLRIPHSVMAARRRGHPRLILKRSPML